MFFQGIILFGFVDVIQPSYGDYAYPRVAIGLGWVLAICPLLPLPVCAVHQLLSEKGNLKQVTGVQNYMNDFFCLVMISLF